MSLLPISPPSRGSYFRCSKVRSNGSFFLRLSKLSCINSPLGSPELNDFSYTPLRLVPSEKRTPRSFSSKLFTEQQLKEITLEEKKLNENLNDPEKTELKRGESKKSENKQGGRSSPRGFISPKKRAHPEPYSTKPSTKALKHIKTEIASTIKNSAASSSERENSEEPSYEPSHNSTNKKPDEKSEVEDSIKDEGDFNCKHCKCSFKTAQALGGHMSRKHPGRSYDYNRKKEIRMRRELERLKLLLAKKIFYEELGYDYDKLRRMKDGKTRIKKLMNRTRLKKIKLDITKKQLENFIKAKAEESLMY